MDCSAKLRGHARNRKAEFESFPGSFKDVVGVVLTRRALWQPRWRTKTEDFAVEEADGEEKGATETGLQG